MNKLVHEYQQHKIFYSLLFAVFVFKILFANWIPLTSDEAYFITWGKNLDYGYYDHTPFVGWLLAAFLTVSDAVWWLRMPAILLPLFVSWAIYKILDKRNVESALIVSLAYLAAPVSIINVLITTDTPLIYFSFISAWFFYKASISEEAKKQSAYYLLTGLFLGLAFFSKYFAVLLGIAYGLYIVFFQRNKKGFNGLLLILMMVAPFVITNITWNYNNCWNNILFNLFNRTSQIDNPLVSLASYILILGYLYFPFLIVLWGENRKKLQAVPKDKFIQVFLWLSVFPLLIFFFLLFRKQIGLHWLLSFYPFIFIALAKVLNHQQWKKTAYLLIGFSVIHLALISTVLLLPVNHFENKDEAQQNLIIGKHPREVFSQIEQYREKYIIASVSYGMASVASYYTGNRVYVIGEGSVHAREDDSFIDYSELDGKNIIIIKRTASNLDSLREFFVNSKRKTFMVRGVSFELLMGDGFKYKDYHEKVLKKINRRYYSIPSWLPVGQCEFKDKYSF